MKFVLIFAVIAAVCLQVTSAIGFYHRLLEYILNRFPKRNSPDPVIFTCANEFVLGPEEKCFRLFLEKENFTDAQAICMDNGGFLAELDDDNTFDFIQTQLNSLLEVPRYTDWNDAFFVGASRTTDHRFRWLKSRKEIKKDLWGPGEPNNYLGRESCVNVYSGGVNDFNCHHSLRFICQTGGFAGQMDNGCGNEFKEGPNKECFRFFMEKKSKREAERTCADHGSRLAVLDNEDLYQFVQNELGSMRRVPRWNDWNEAFYVGARRNRIDGQFYWQGTDKKINFRSPLWGPNEPNNYLGKESCLDVFKGGINDFDCDNPLRFICQHKNERIPL